MFKILGSLFGKAGSDIGTGIAKASDGIRCAITGDLPVDLKKNLIEISSELDKLTQQVNLAEAQNANIFISGWRPAIGWIGSLALAYIYLLYPFISWICNMLSVACPPDINNEILMELIFALLGVSTLRTLEKVRR